MEEKERRQLEIQKKKEENQKVYPPQVPHLPFCYTGQAVMSFRQYTGVPHYCQVTQPAIGVTPTAPPPPPPSQVVAAPGGQHTPFNFA